MYVLYILSLVYSLLILPIYLHKTYNIHHTNMQTYATHTHANNSLASGIRRVYALLHNHKKTFCFNQNRNSNISTSHFSHNIMYKEIAYFVRQHFHHVRSKST